MKVDYSNMSLAVRRSFMEEQNKGAPIVRQKKQCPGGDFCPYPDLLCNECELEH